jgi:putative transcriptional regulator
MKLVRSLFALAALLIVATGARAVAVDDSPVVLVARLDMGGFYSRTVLLARPVGGGRHVGFIVNRPTPISTADIVGDRGSPQRDEPVYFGGPLHTNVVFLLMHRSEAPPGRAIALARDTYLAADAEAIEQAIGDEHHGKRVFAGLVLWQTGELEREVAQGLWYVMSAEPGIVFSAAPDTLWEDLVRRVRMF